MSGAVIDELVEDALHEFADERSQRVWWLASEGPEVSSFIECHERLVDDSGLGTALDKPEVVYDPKIDDQLRELVAVLGRIDGFRPPAEILNDPLMVQVRDLATALLEAFPGIHPGVSRHNDTEKRPWHTQPGCILGLLLGIIVLGFGIAFWIFAANFGP